MFWSAIVTNFNELLLSRLFLGIVTAAAGPLVASLVGDYFPAAERGRIYGYILAGELLGAGFGFAVTGDIATHLVAGGVRRARRSRPRARVVRRQAAGAAARRDGAARERPSAPRPRRSDEGQPSDAQQLAREHGIEPDPALVLRHEKRRLRGRGQPRAARADEPHPDRGQRVRLLLPRRHPDVRLRVREGAVPDRPGVRERAAAARRHRRRGRRARRRVPRRLRSCAGGT